MSVYVVQGGTVDLDVEILDGRGDRTDPDAGTLQLVLKDPAGATIRTVVASGLTRLSVGLYRYTWQPADDQAVGAYEAVWTGELNGRDLRLDSEDVLVVLASQIATIPDLAYATVDDLSRLLPKLNIGRDRDILQDCLNRGAAVINARAKRDFWRHPATGEETWTVDVSQLYSAEGAMWLPVPQGILSVSKVEWAYGAGLSYQEFADDQVVLRPEIPEFEQPYWQIRISSSPLVAGRFWPGTNTVRITGARGFETPPSIVRAGNLALAREMVPAAIAAGGAPRGSWENPNALLPTEAYVAVQWAQSLGGGGSWFA